MLEIEDLQATRDGGQDSSIEYLRRDKAPIPLVPACTVNTPQECRAARLKYREIVAFELQFRDTQAQKWIHVASPTAAANQDVLNMLVGCCGREDPRSEDECANRMQKLRLAPFMHGGGHSSE